MRDRNDSASTRTPNLAFEHAEVEPNSNGGRRPCGSDADNPWREYELAKQLCDTVQCIILLLDNAGRILLVNPYFEKLTGWQLDEVRDRNWFDTFIPGRDRAQVAALFRRALEGSRTRANVNAILTKDGQERDIEWYDAPLKSLQGELAGLLCIGKDITGQRGTEAALQRSQEHHRAVLNAAADAIITMDEDGTIRDCNNATYEMFGYEQGELIGQPVRALMPRPYCDEHDDYVQRYLNTRQPKIIGVGRELVAQRKDSSTFPILLTVSEIDQLNMFAGIVRDISTTKELQRQILEIAAQEDRRIGLELHDNTQQQLTGLALLAQSLAETLAEGHAPQAQMATRLAKGIQEAAGDVHRLARGLVPVEVDASGLRYALDILANRTSQSTGITCQFHCPDELAVADNFVATHLFRIGQEAVNNAVKHSGADRIEVSLERADGNIHLQVLDNGTGITEKRMEGAGMGLRIMQYRAGLIGATLQVEPALGQGTLVRCIIPRQKAAGDDS